MRADPADVSLLVPTNSCRCHSIFVTLDVVGMKSGIKPSTKRRCDRSSKLVGASEGELPTSLRRRSRPLKPGSSCSCLLPPRSLSLFARFGTKARRSLTIVFLSHSFVCIDVFATATTTSTIAFACPVCHYYCHRNEQLHHYHNDNNNTSSTVFCCISCPCLPVIGTETSAAHRREPSFHRELLHSNDINAPSTESSLRTRLVHSATVCANIQTFKCASPVLHIVLSK